MSAEFLQNPLEDIDPEESPFCEDENWINRNDPERKREVVAADQETIMKVRELIGEGISDIALFSAMRVVPRRRKRRR